MNKRYHRPLERYNNLVRAIQINNHLKEQLALNNLDYKKLETTHLSVVKEFKAYREAVMGIDITYMIEIL